MGSKKGFRTEEGVVEIGELISNVITFLHAFYTRVSVVDRIRDEERVEFNRRLRKSQKELVKIRKIFSEIE